MKPEKPEPNVIDKMELRYDFDENEIVELARKQGFKHKDLDTVEAEKKMSASQYKGRIEILQGEIEACTDKIMAGFEMRMVDIGVFYHSPKQGMKTLVRMDNGKEIDIKHMTQAECQSKLPLEEEADAGEVTEGEDTEAEVKALPDTGWTIFANELPDVDIPVMFRDTHGREFIGMLPGDAPVLEFVSVFNCDNVTVDKIVAWRRLTVSELEQYDKEVALSEPPAGEPYEPNAEEPESADTGFDWTLLDEKLPEYGADVVFRNNLGQTRMGKRMASSKGDIITSDDAESSPLDTALAWRLLTEADSTEQSEEAPATDEAK